MEPKEYFTNPENNEEPSDDTLYRKYKTVEKEVPVTNPFKRLVRRFQGKDSPDTEIIEEKVVEEEYSYGKIKEIVALGQDKGDLHNESMKIVQETMDPDVFFPRLTIAVDSLEELLDLKNKYSFVAVKGDEIKPILNNLKENKSLVIKEFTDRYYSASVMEIMKLDSKEEKDHAYLENYQRLVRHFSEIPDDLIDHINAQWVMKIPEDELYKPD